MAGRFVGTLRHIIKGGGIISELTSDPSLLWIRGYVSCWHDFSVVDKVRRDGGHMAGRFVGTLRHIIKGGGIISELTSDVGSELTSDARLRRMR
jgi:hypothetical protein